MTKFSKKDLGFSLITGFMTGAIVWQILTFLDVPTIYGFPVAGLVIAGPIIAIFGTWLGYFLGQWMKFFDQFGKFCVIGLSNASVDFGVLNLLIGLSGYAAGWWFTGFKAGSFIVASISSYIFNKYWAFNAGDTGGGGVEFGKFLTVAVAGIIVNNLAASFVVNGIGPIGTFTAAQWANIGAVAGSLVALVFSFVGYKLIVFKR